MKKQYLRKELENLLLTIQMLITIFIMLTIESIGNATYNKIFAITMIVFILNSIILNKYSKTFNS